MTKYKSTITWKNKVILRQDSSSSTNSFVGQCNCFEGI